MCCLLSVRLTVQVTRKEVLENVTKKKCLSQELYDLIDINSSLPLKLIDTVFVKYTVCILYCNLPGRSHLHQIGTQLTWSEQLLTVFLRNFPICILLNFNSVTAIYSSKIITEMFSVNSSPLTIGTVGPLRIIPESVRNAFKRFL